MHQDRYVQRPYISQSTVSQIHKLICLLQYVYAPLHPYYEPEVADDVYAGQDNWSDESYELESSENEEFVPKMDML